MARSEPAPSVHTIEPARSGRSRCETCKAFIADGELRLSEAYVKDEGPGARAVANARTRRPRDPLGDSDRRYNDDSSNPDLGARFHHLACAAQHEPYILRSALTSTGVEVPERAALEQAIERALLVVDVAEEATDTREEYRRSIERLRESDDDTLLMVFADWLQNHGDPRGELAAVQRQLAEGPSNPALVALEKKLLAAHRDRFVPDRFEGELTWRSGFVRRLTLATNTSLDRVTLARIFTHPSFRLLRELVVPLERMVIAASLPSLPPTLRVLELGKEPATPSDYYDLGLGDVAALINDAPQLQRLMLGEGCALSLRSPVLAELELRSQNANLERPLAAANGARASLVARLPALTASTLPKLRTLRLRVDRGLDDALATVMKLELAPQLHTLGLHGDLSASALSRLALPGLQVLDLRGSPAITNADFERLQGVVPSVLRDERAPLVEKKPVSTEWRVRHTRKPEWGIGIVVSEGDAGLEVEFPNAGRKQVRNVELLEDVSES